MAMTNAPTVVSTWNTKRTAVKKAKAYQSHSNTYDYHVEPHYDADAVVYRVVATPVTTSYKVTVNIYVDATSSQQAIETVESLNLYADYGVEYDIEDSVEVE